MPCLKCQQFPLLLLNFLLLLLLLSSTLAVFVVLVVGVGVAGVTCSNKAHRRHVKANFPRHAAGGATI